MHGRDEQPTVTRNPPFLPGSYLVVELTNQCSLRCVHCSVSDQTDLHYQQNGFMQPSLFTQLIDDLVDVESHFQTLILFWLGEPLLHPQFADLWRHAVRAANQHHIFDQIEVHTNATHLTREMSRAITNEGLVPQMWHFSLDANTTDTYLRIKGRDRFTQVVDNIKYFLHLRQQLGARWPRPIFQFIVGENNEDEAAGFLETWTHACEQNGVPVKASAGHVPPGEEAIVFFRQQDCPTPILQEKANHIFQSTMDRLDLQLSTEPTQSKSVAKRIDSHNLAPCAGFWKSPTVGWEGHVTACTRDGHLVNTLGNLRDSSFSELWWGEQMRARRDQVAAADYSNLPLCQSCFIPQSLNHGTLTDADLEIHQEFERTQSCSVT